jgi:endonuclease/exonuclease/phosphatase family metal-dependent hydrolase
MRTVPDQQKPSSSLRERFFSLIMALIDVYAFGIIVYLLLRLITQERLWPVAVINHVIHWLLVPSVLMTLLFAGLRRWPRTALNAVGTAAFLVLFGEFFLPALPAGDVCASSAAGCSQIRVMTFNTHAEPETDVSSKIDAVLESGADVIALQEMSVALAAAIDSELMDEYPYQALHPVSIPGAGMISKVPFDKVEAVNIGELYITIHVVITVDNSPVSIFCTHTSPPTLDLSLGYASKGRGDIRKLIDLAEDQEAVLILGDFNTVDQMQDYRIFRNAGYKDAFREAGWGWGSTFPDYDSVPIQPFMRIDYIFHSADFHSRRAWVGPETVSDHRPVIADLVYSP